MSLANREFQICELLTQRPQKGMYGLQLVEESKGDLPRGSVYVLLGRMEERGLVESRLEEDRGGPSRRYYRLSPRGSQVFGLVRQLRQIEEGHAAGGYGLATGFVVAFASLCALAGSSAFSGPESGTVLAALGMGLGARPDLSASKLIGVDLWRDYVREDPGMTNSTGVHAASRKRSTSTEVQRAQRNLLVVAFLLVITILGEAKGKRRAAEKASRIAARQAARGRKVSKPPLAGALDVANLLYSRAKRDAFEAAVLDVREEYHNALAGGAKWRARFTHVRGAVYVIWMNVQFVVGPLIGGMGYVVGVVTGRRDPSLG